MDKQYYLLKNGLIITGEQDPFRGHLLFNSEIQQVSTELPFVPTDTEIIDCTGLLIRPGGIDIHTHFNLKVSPTLKTAENFSSGTRGALMGGITTIGDFATQNSGQSLIECYEQRWQQLSSESRCSFLLHLAVTDWKPDSFQQIAFLQEKYGLKSIKVFTTYKDRNYNSSYGEIYTALCKSREMQYLLMIHCEENDVIEYYQNLVKENDSLSEIDKFRLSRPSIAEATAVNTVCYLNSQARGNLYVVHVSTPESVRIVSRYRSDFPEGRYLLETCPQYFLLNDTVFQKEQGYFYVSQPQLKSPSEADELFRMVLGNTFDVLATDNCAYFKEAKNAGIKEGFLNLPPGMPGTQFLLPLTYSALVEEGNMPLNHWVRLTAKGPAENFGLDRSGILKTGKSADILLFDPAKKWEITLQDIQSGADWSPYLGKTITGKVVATFLKGKLLYAESPLKEQKIKEENMSI